MIIIAIIIFLNLANVRISNSLYHCNIIIAKCGIIQQSSYIYKNKLMQPTNSVQLAMYQLYSDDVAIAIYSRAHTDQSYSLRRYPSKKISSKIVSSPLAYASIAAPRFLYTFLLCGITTGGCPGLAGVNHLSGMRA